MTWSAPTTGGAPVEFVLQAAVDPGFANIVYDQGTGSIATTLTIPGVPMGTFQLRVRARNSAGTSDPSNSQQISSVVCTAAPPPPIGFAITKLGGVAVRLAWSAPAATSNAPTDYVIQAALGESFVPLIYNQAVGGPMTALEAQASPGTFFVRMRSRNACGDGAASNTAIVTLP
jgi:predicted phage tail protein